MSPSDELTPPLKLEVSDRIALERRIDAAMAVAAVQMASVQSQIDALKGSIAFLQKATWFVIGGTTVSLVVQIIRIIAIHVGGAL